MPNSIEISQELETTPETEMAGPPEEALSEVKSTTSSEPKVEELSEITPAEIETGAEPSTQIEDSPASKENIQEVEYVEPLVDELPTDSMENPPESETIALSKDSEEKINIEANDQQTVEVDGLISQDTSECVTEERMPSSKQENMPEVKLTQPKLVDEICSGPCIKPQITQISGLEGDTGIALTVNEGQGKFQMTITGACEESKQINVNLWFPPCNEECKDTQAIIKEPQSAFQEEGNTDTSKKENESDEINTENEMKDEEMKDDDKQIAEEVIPFDIEIMEQNENEQTAEIEIDPIDTIDDGNLDTTIEHDEVEDNMPILTSESEPEKNNENDEEQIEFSPTDFEEERESKANAVLFQGEEISIMSEKQLSVDSSTEDIGTYKENEVCSGICAIGADIKISPSMIQKAIQGLSVIVGDGCGQAKLNLTKSDELSKVLHVGLEFLDCTELCPRCKSLAPQKKTYEDDDVTVCK
ncbi:hypothetical protein C0J52_25001 [Blattella germanica]|nr:hypothetical protein C0J52_25001 [Blattella germanica]